MPVIPKYDHKGVGIYFCELYFCRSITVQRVSWRKTGEVLTGIININDNDDEDNDGSSVDYKSDNNGFDSE